MANEYVDLLQSGQTVNAEKGGNPYLDLINTDNAISTGAARAGATLAIDSNPDDIARQKRIAQSLNVPFAAVEADPAFATKEQKIRQIEQTPPVLKQKFSDADFAKLAHDDVENLSGIETALMALKNTGNAAVSGLRGGSAGAVGAARMPFDLAAPLLDPLVGNILPANPLRATADGLGKWQKGISDRAAAEMPKGESIAGSGYYSGVASFSRNVVALPLAFLPGGQNAALGMMVAPVAGEEYGKGREAGLSPIRSLNYAASQAVIEYATEKIPLTRLLGDVKAGSSFVKTLTRQVAAEVPGEQVATVLQDLNEWALLNPTKPFKSYLEERPSAAAQTLVATLVGTGGQVTLVKGAEKALDYFSSKSEQDKAAATDTERSSQVLAGLNQLVAVSKLTGRDQATAQSFFQSVIDEGGDSIYISPDALAQSGMADAIAQNIPIVAEQMQTESTGHDIRIPIAELMAKMAGPEIEVNLLPHVATEPGGFTPTTAQEFLNSGAAQELQADIERVMGEQSQTDAFRTSQEAVKTMALDELNKAGRFTSQKNELDATLIAARTAVRAAQLGITPEAMFQRQLLKVQAEGAGGVLYDQSGAKIRAPSSEAFKEWNGKYSKSKATGVLYHKTKGDFDSFDPAKRELGFHFGTLEQAEGVAVLRDNPEGTNIMPVRVAVKNPLRLKDEGSFHADGIANQLAKKKIIDKALAKQINSEIEADWKARKKWDDVLREAIQSAGYDGIVYKNEHEAPGDSWIVFEPTQIKSAIGNRGTFDPNDPNILNQSANGSKQVAVTRLDSVFEGDHLKQAEQFYKQNVQGKTVDNPSIGEVRFSAEGLGKLLSGNRESALRASVVKVLPELMANAELTDLDIDRKWRGHVEGFKYLIAPLEHDGKLYAVRMTVKQGQQGGSFYTLEGFKADTLSAIVGQNASYPGSEGTSSLNPTVRLDFLETEVNDLNRVFHPDGGSPANRGAFSPETNTISLLKNADLSTFLHEAGHFFFENDISLAAELAGEANALGYDILKPGEKQILSDVSALLSWHGIQGDINTQLGQWYGMDFEERRAYHERTAESFEAYLFEGKSPSIELQHYFQTFRAWLVSVYKSLNDFVASHPEAGQLSDEVRAVFDRMLATSEQIALAEQGRSMMPLFETPEQAGMTPDEFAAYQANGTDASNQAIEELQGRGLRDMQWLRNARGRILKQLQKDNKSKRAEVEIEARREVMSQPVYQAWDFLTRKLGAEDVLPERAKSDPNVVDPSQDSLFTAIGKLGGMERTQVQSEWGVDPKERIPMTGFGKHVLRLTGGLPIDSMAEVLSQHGYLPLNEHGQYELNDLGDLFLEELRGNPQFSNAFEPESESGAVSNPSGLMAGRFDLNTLGEMGYSDEQINLLKARRMTANEGLHPDIVAEMPGIEMSSGDELVQRLAAAIPPKEAIEQLTDHLMMQRYGDINSQAAMDAAADMAIHNEVRARMIATEANALAKATGKPKILASAAREFARNIIARLKVRDIHPAQYTSAEVRAAKASAKAEKAGDIATAAAEKRNQLINTYAAKAAYDAQDTVEKGVRYLKKFDSAGTRKALDIDYIDQIDAILERFDLRKQSNKAIDRRTSLAAWLDTQREAGLEPDISPELENEAYRTPYKNMTVEEFSGLIDTVKQIEHLGRLKKKLLTAKDTREFKAIVAEAEASIIENGGEARPVQIEEPTGIMPWLEGFAVAHRKFASLLRQMDGGKDGGVMWRILGRGMNDAGTAEAVMNEDATKRLTEIYTPVLALKGGLHGDKVFIPEIGDSLTRGARLSVALNWGNITNRSRIMEGDQWTEHQVNAILSRLTRVELDFVNNAWAFIDSYWTQIADKERRVTGRAPDKVEANPFSIRLPNDETVAMTGGYYPIKYDSNRDDRAEQHEAADIANDMKRGAFTRATTRRGHTKQRVEHVGRPVRKSLDVITQHVSEVTHDLAWHEWLIDANRLIDAGQINGAIREYYGTPVLRTMKDHLTAIATADIVPQTQMDRALLYLRSNVSRSTMGISLTTAFLQPFGLAQSMVRIGPKHVLRGVARWAGDASRFENSLAWIGDKSDFMRLRRTTFNRELNEIRGRVSKGRSKARLVYDASLFMLMQKMQLVADVPTWIGQYEKAIATGLDEDTAVAMADQSVLDSQGGGQTKDLAELQRKHPMLTMFYSYFNTTYNLAAESTAQTNFKNPLAVAGWMSDMMLLMVIPALGPAIILELLRGGGGDDSEEWAKKLLEWQASYLLGLTMGVRELSGLVTGYDYTGPPAVRIVVDAGKLGKQVAQGEADEGLAVASIRLLGSATGIPTTQLLRSWRGWVAWEDGEAPATSILLGPPPPE